MDEQPPGRLGDVEVGVQQHLQGVPQFSRLGFAVGSQFAERFGHEPAQLRRLAHQAQQPERPQGVEMCDGAGAVQLPTHVNRPAGLLVHLRNLFGVVDDAADTGRERAPAASPVAGDDADHRAYHSVGIAARRHRQQRHDLLRKTDDRRGRSLHPDRPFPRR